MRPTGKLHLGHLVGALQNWVELQAKYDSYHCIVDWHALTTNYADTSEIVANGIDNAADWIGSGLDPEKSTFFVQSLVPEHAELFLLLSMVVPGWREARPANWSPVPERKKSPSTTQSFAVRPSRVM